MYSCTECGMSYTKWVGKCGGCGNWNTLVEETESAPSFFGKKAQKKSKSSESLKLLDISEIESKTEDRIQSNLPELDMVLGGGFVKGSTVLIGGDPGIGKSTLLIQTVQNLSDRYKCVYVTGEESLNQVAMRAKRLGGNKESSFKISCGGCVEKIIKTIEAEQVDFLIIDSIQTMYLEAIESQPGSVSQLKAATYELMNYCKSREIILILVGHVTKDGQLAGPKLLEHMVDVMLYFDGENNNHFRILRGIKNRFGAANEMGIFQMSDSGLRCITNPSEIFLSTTKDDIQGRIAFATLEGSRSVLLEIETLTSPSFIPNPRRTTVGWDNNRLNMMIAILSAKCGLNFSDKDVYLSILGGMKTSDPAADLAVCISLVSSLKKEKILQSTIAIGEMSLSGEIRTVFQIERRVSEAIKLGFKNIIIPQGSLKIKPKDAEITEIKSVSGILKVLGI